jgi:putative membrane protein
MNSSVDGGRPLRWVLVPLVLIAVVATIAVGASLYFRSVPGQYYGWWPWAPFGWLFFIPIFFLAFFALRFFFWGWWGGWGWYHGQDTATLVLRERFARGELTREQFEQMTKDLS